MILFEEFRNIQEFTLNESNIWSKFTKTEQTQMANINKRILLSKLHKAGFTNKMAQANILAQVQYESAFIPKSEYTNWSAKGLFEHYGKGNKYGNKVRFDSVEDAQSYVDKGPTVVFDKIYGGRMGNNKPGDAIKYRGRGLIQMTGKNKYKSYSQKLGVDLLKNPDLVNHPKYALDTLIIFFSQFDKNKLADGDYANKVVGASLNNAKRTARKRTALKYFKQISDGKLTPLDPDKGVKLLTDALNGKKVRLDVASEYTPEDDDAKPDNEYDLKLADNGVTTNENPSNTDSDENTVEVATIIYDPAVLSKEGVGYFKNINPNDASLA